MNTIARYMDDRRVQLHLRLAELQLRQRKMSGLSPTQQQARMRLLEVLHHYRQQSIFPHNVAHKQRSPIFIDPDGRVCAVAHLVIQSGHAEVAKCIHLVTNDAYVRDMPFPELDQWAQANGLTREELARIQPTYEPTVSDPAAFAALMSTANNFIHIAGLGIVIGLWLLFMNLYSLLKRISTLRWAVLLTASGISSSLFAYFIVHDLLSSMHLMLDYGGMPYATRGYGLQFSQAVGVTGIIFLTGIGLTVLGLVSLGIQYAARRIKRQNKAAAIG
jgi:hypothetical protein